MANPRRYTSNSKAGRQIMANTPVRQETGLTKEQKEWNAQVDAKRAAKLAAKHSVDELTPNLGV